MGPVLTAAAAAQLQDGINLVLSRWAALRMAVENEWGGRESLQKSQQLGVDLFQRLTQSKEEVYLEDLEEMLDEFMLSLNTEIDDGSIEEIAEKLMLMREECVQGDFNSINSLRITSIPSISSIRQPGSNNEDESDDDSEEDDGNDDSKEANCSEMDVDVPQSQSGLHSKNSTTDEPRPTVGPEVVDGWTVVGSRRNRGGRKN